MKTCLSFQVSAQPLAADAASLIERGNSLKANIE
jgi:hypothetical protein